MHNELSYNDESDYEYEKSLIEYDVFNQPRYKTNLLTKIYSILLILIAIYIYVTSITRNRGRLKRPQAAFLNRNEEQPSDASQPALKNTEDTTQQKQQALEKAELKTSKHWAENKDDIAIDEEYLKQLDEMISREDWFQITTGIDFNQEERLYITNNTTNNSKDADKEKTKEIKQRRATTFSKKEQPANSTMASKDKVLMWHANLPGYNLTKHVCTDPNRIVYPLNSGNRFIFINKYLNFFLESNHPEALARLIHLCEMGKDQLPDRSRGQSGFIFREEGNAKTFDKSIKNDPNNNNKEKNTKTNYVKVKDCKQNYRFFGKGIAIVNEKKELFEVNGFKPRHKKQDKITYFPSETAKIK